MPRERREQQILDVAGGVFARAGYHSASMDEIADSAGVSKPMLYAYFRSKEGLYLAYIKRAGAQLLERLVGARARDDSASALLRSRITEFLTFVQEHRDGWKVLFGEVGSTRPFAENVAALREQIADAIRVMIEAGARSWPGYPPPASDAIAHALVGAGESLANWWLDHPGVTRDEVADWYYAVVQAVLAGPSRGSG
ncbi:MAG TPA: TetR/AcrR family transcriptional regulator [Solirubrobacteraceae bacterium]|nr:TetR/AcrR family transcriptional regulator [Solirubrobacteraceae bacterium]